MKKIALIFVFIFLLSTNALAEKITCKAKDNSTFTVEVPVGWKSKNVEGGCVVAKQDGSEFISIAYFPANGLKAKEFAQQMVIAMKVTPTYNSQKEDYVDMDVIIEGTKVNITVISDGTGSAQVITQKPEESKDLDAIFDSVKFD